MVQKDSSRRGSCHSDIGVGEANRTLNASQSNRIWEMCLWARTYIYVMIQLRLSPNQGHYELRLGWTEFGRGVD